MKASELRSLLQHVPDNAEVWVEYPYPQRIDNKDSVDGTDGESHIIATKNAGYTSIRNRVVLWHT